MMPPTPWQWQFPPCYQWVPGNDFERINQLLKVRKEVDETFRAFEHRGEDGMLPYAMELMDVIHACETALREFEPHQLDAIKALTIKKNDDRRYYDGRA